jgi:hypothetical protein
MARQRFQLIELHTLLLPTDRDRITDWQDQVRGLLRCGISIPVRTALGQKQRPRSVPSPSLCLHHSRKLP